MIHDHLYWAQGCTREQADRLMVIAMKENKVGSLDEFAIYTAVHGLGQTAWDNTAQERQQGIPKVIPDQYIRPKDGLFSFPSG